MPIDNRHHSRRYGSWLTLRPIGGGGQAEVFLACQIPENQFTALSNIADKLRVRTSETPVLNILLEISTAIEHAPVGALKTLHDPAKARNAKTAGERFCREFEILKTTDDPALVKVLDGNPAQSWFVMEYHRRCLANQITRYKGDVIGAYSALRPLIQAVAALHKRNMIHRDIKPENIFIADDDRLVLGDFGLIYLSEDDRLTSTSENVGTRRWMAPWTMDRRVDELRPSCDVYSLAKVLWALVSGQPHMRGFFDEDANNLEKLFPDDPLMKILNETIFSWCLVEREQKCSRCPTGIDFLSECDSIILGDGILKRVWQQKRPLPPSAIIPEYKDMLQRIEELEHFAEELKRRMNAK